MAKIFDSIRKIVWPVVSTNEMLDPEVKQTSEITPSEIPSYKNFRIRLMLQKRLGGLRQKKLGMQKIKKLHLDF